MKNKFIYLALLVLLLTVIYIVIDNNKIRKYNYTIDFKYGYANISLDIKNTFKANKIIKEINNIYNKDLTTLETSKKLKKYLDNNIDDYLINTNGIIISKNTNNPNYKIGLIDKEYYHFVNIENECLITFKGSREITIIGKDLDKIYSIYKDIRNKDIKKIKEINNYKIIIYDGKVKVI